MKNLISLIFWGLLGNICLLQAQTWSPIGANLSGSGSGFQFGHALATNQDGRIVAVGAPKEASTGIVHVYERIGDSLLEKGSPIAGEFGGEDFGWSLDCSADGLTLVVGAPDDNGSGSNPGRVRVYEWQGGIWQQKGQTLQGINGDDGFGTDVAINAAGNRMVVGATHDDTNAFNAGAAEVFGWDSLAQSWTSLGTKLLGSGATELFGQAVEMNAAGDVIIVGGPYFSGNYFPGFIRVFAWNGSDWVQRGPDFQGEGGADHAGNAVDISGSGNTIAFGSFNNSSSAGHVRMFDWDGTNWVQKGADVDGENNYDLSGYSLSLSEDGDVLAVGAPWQDGNGDKSGHVKVYRWKNLAWEPIGQAVFGGSTNANLGLASSLSGDGSTLVAGGPTFETNGQIVGQAQAFSYTPATAVAQFLPPMQWEVAPNPTSGEAWVSFAQPVQGAILRMVDVQGRVLTHKTLTTAQELRLQFPQEAGIYFLHLQSGQQFSTKKVLVYP